MVWHGILHRMLAEVGSAYALFCLLTPPLCLGLEVETMLILITRQSILLQRHVLVTKQQIGLSIGGVNVDSLMQQFDGRLVLPNDAFLHRLLEQRLALGRLPKGHHRQQQHQ